ncbi:hypothetical protein SO802_029162 [Lithocarpus litseifolius]|uniref:Retropepsins domain-containing protein n=1 Tax=Lithocarpus litseifolius TaxID=425828 RepID=A0AAW2BU99_9ROSI
MAKQDSVVDQDDDNSQRTPSLRISEMEQPEPPPRHQLMVIRKVFTPDLVALGKEFDSERNRVKREAYRADHTLEQKKEVLEKWQEFMKEISSNVPFFEYFENHFEWHKNPCVLTKSSWTKEDKIKKKPVTSLSSKNPLLSVLDIHTTSSSSSRTSSESEKEIKQLENQKSKSKDNYEKFSRKRIAFKQYRRQKYGVFKDNDFNKEGKKSIDYHKETKEPRPRNSEPKVNLKKIYNRFTKTKKEVTVNDLQQKIKETKFEVRTLKQELTFLRVDHSLLDQKIKRLISTSHQGNEKGPSFQNPLDEVDKTVNPTAHMVQEEQPNQKFLETISGINFQKWHSKVKIVISKDFEFEVIVLIDSGADLNCIQEGIIPSKYFRKTRERLTSASGGKMQIEFKFPKAHVCQNNTCFKTTFVLGKNMTDRVILENPFMCLLYPFVTDSEGITTHPFGRLVKFKFLRNLEPRDISSL